MLLYNNAIEWFTLVSLYNHDKNHLENFNSKQYFRFLWLFENVNLINL